MCVIRYSAALGIFLGLFLELLCPNASYAVTRLKQINVAKDREVKLVFDQRVNKDDVTIDFLNDIVQLSIQRVSIYPAKIIPLNGKLIKKVFAYQYSPKVIRCRFSFGDKVEKYKNHVHLYYSGKVILVKVDELPSSPPEVTQKPEPQISETELLNKVLQSSKPTAVNNEDKPAETDNHSRQHPLSDGVSQKAVGKSNGFGAILKTLAVLSVLGLIVFVFNKKIGLGSLKQLTHFVETNLKKDKKLIQVVGKYYLEPKKSLVLVRVGERLLLLGSSHESISLITEMSGNIKSDMNQKETTEAEAPEVSGDQIFAEFLNSEQDKPLFSESKFSESSVRSRIRNRLEGFKPL